MSRVAKKPIMIPKGVDITLSNNKITVKGSQGQMEHVIPDSLLLNQEEDVLRVIINESHHEVVRFGEDSVKALAGTTRAIVNNIVQGAHQGFERKLVLVGVGYRAQVQGNKINLTLGLSHPAFYELPEGIKAETPSPTEIVIKGVDKQKVGQVASEIRLMRPPEPYKGKGIRYADEVIIQKETKKK